MGQVSNPGRPAGEVRQALWNAAVELATQGRAPTMRELAARACVGEDAALHTVKNMTRAGELCISGRRRVPYRSRPVAEYRPAVQDASEGEGFVDLGTLLCVWAR